MQNKSYDGIAFISKDYQIPFHFQDGKIELFLGGTCTLEEGATTIIGQSHGTLCGGFIYFNLPIPIENVGVMYTISETGQSESQAISMGNVKYDVDFYIEKYEVDAEINQMRFSFPELDYFLPSSDVCEALFEANTIKTMTFPSTPIIVKNFSFTLKGCDILFTLRIRVDGKWGSPRSTATTKSELLLEFEKTKELDFLVDLFYIVNDFFCFLCNRKNIALENATLIGVKHLRSPISGDEKAVPVTQILQIVDRYKDMPESEKTIGKIINYYILETQLEKLFSLFVDNKVSVQSIHSSCRARNLLDLKQSLQITAAFEHYYREYIPETPSDIALEFYSDIKALLEAYAKNNTGKKKKKANNLIKGLLPEPALSDKVSKTYDGCENWNSLAPVLDEWFNGQIDELANVANDWRNELAHQNGRYEPDMCVVSAIRLVEHLNYCIVLRQAGYSDEQIKNIIKIVLAR